VFGGGSPGRLRFLGAWSPLVYVMNLDHSRYFVWRASAFQHDSLFTTR
jgi:hypothetical protein